MHISIMDTDSYASFQEALSAGGLYQVQFTSDGSTTFAYGRANEFMVSIATGMRCLDGNFCAKFYLQSDSHEFMDVVTFSEGNLIASVSSQDEAFVDSFVEANVNCLRIDAAYLIKAIREGFTASPRVPHELYNQFAASLAQWNTNLGRTNTLDANLSVDGAHAAARKYGWIDVELEHALANLNCEYVQETVIALANGRAIHCPTSETDCHTIRITQEGYELAFWTSEEWCEAPNEVMGAILGAANGCSLLAPKGKPAGA